MAADSHAEFTTSNYMTATKPIIEWHFVADPNDQEFLTSYCGGVWPEDKQPHKEDGGRVFKRSPVPPKDFAPQLGELNRKLTTANEPLMLLVEFIACRLYTGPMFVKYNTVLRGLGASKVRMAPPRLRHHACATTPRTLRSLRSDAHAPSCPPAPPRTRAGQEELVGDE